MMVKKKDIEIQPGFKPGFSKFQLNAVTNWATNSANKTLSIVEPSAGINTLYDFFRRRKVSGWPQ